MKHFNKIINLKEYDLVLTYSFGASVRNCTGHIFECIEYFHILKEHFKVAILIGDCVDFADILDNIMKKYNFTLEEKTDIIDNLFIGNNPHIVIGNNLLLVDGNFKRLADKKMFFDNKMCFPCGVQKYEDYPQDVTIFADERVYDFYGDNVHHYVKKMLFSKMDLPTIEEMALSPEYDYMMYITEGPRELTTEQIEKLAQKYYHGSIVIYTDYDIRVNSPNVTIKRVPVDDTFNFKTYIYSSIERQFDCSPRFIVECQLRGKNVIYELNYNMSNDKGLFFRNRDLNDINSIELKPNDSIINKIKNSIK